MESNSKTACGILPESKLTFVDVLTPFTQKPNGTVGPPSQSWKWPQISTLAHAHTHYLHCAFLEEQRFLVNPEQFSSKECTWWIFGNESTHSLTSFRVSEGHLPCIYTKQDYTCIMVTSWLKYIRCQYYLYDSVPTAMICIMYSSQNWVVNFVDRKCKSAQEIDFNIWLKFGWNVWVRIDCWWHYTGV